jgi:hypothetical protein
MISVESDSINSDIRLLGVTQNPVVRAANGPLLTSTLPALLDYVIYQMLAWHHTVSTPRVSCTRLTLRLVILQCVFCPTSRLRKRVTVIGATTSSYSRKDHTTDRCGDGSLRYKRHLHSSLQQQPSQHSSIHNSQ